MKLPKISTNFDFWLIVIPLLLAASSISTLFSITSVSQKTQLAVNQGIYFIIGFALYFLIVAFNYRQLRSYGFYLYLFGLAGIILVIFFGQTVFGSRRSIDFGPLQYQPSEFMKLFLLFFGAYFFADRKVSVRSTIVYIFLIIVPIIFVYLQPDLGTTLVLAATALSIFIAARPSKKIILVSAAVLLLAIPVGWLSLKDYQKERLTTFLNPMSDPLGSGYNVNQSKIAVGSGGLTGKGFGNATQSQLQFIPVAHIDFIFSGWAEATGFMGSAAMIVGFLLLIWRVINAGYLSQDSFGYLFCMGASGMLIFQAFVNIAMNIGLAPVTGIPLPLVSYGGASIITTMMILGVVQNIYMRRRSLKFD